MTGNNGAQADRVRSPLGTLPLGWRLAQLKDITIKIGSGATPRGGDSVYLPSRDTYALIRSQNVFDRRFSSESLAFISDEHANQLAGVDVKLNDVLLNITGDGITFARSCLAPAEALPARVNQHVAIIRPDSQVCSPGYLVSYLTHPLIKPYIESFNAGGSRRAVTKGHIESFLIPLPPPTEQRAIAHVLGTLDDKIELNRRMNQTLEEIARALFRSWFVDFDPVWAKGDGRRPKGMDAETAALFPDLFIDTDDVMPLVPVGWEVQSLDQIANYLNGLALQKYPVEGDDWLPAIKIAQLRKGDSTGADRVGAHVPVEYQVDDGDVLFSWSGSLEVDIWCGRRGALNQHLFKVTSARYPKWFYYFWTKHHLPHFREVAAGKATTMGHIQRHHLRDAEVLVPPQELLSKLDRVMSPLVEKVVANRLESRTLAQIRDALLPLLLSGELRIPDAERCVAEAGV